MTLRNIKIAILERDGVELDGPEEHSLVSNEVGFTSVGFSAEDVLNAIIEAKTVAANVGGEKEVYKEKVDQEISLRTLKPGSGIVLTQTADTIEVINNAGEFGGVAEYIEDETETSTTSTTYVQKLRLTVVDLPIGKYRLMWQAECKNPSGSSKSMEVRVQIDDITTIYEAVKQNSAGVFESLMGFKQNLDLDGAHTFDFDYRKVTGTATIRRARIELWRVS